MPRLCFYCVSLLVLLVALASCSAPGESLIFLPPGMAFLQNSEESTYSEILSAQQRFLLSIELVDDVRPPHRMTIQGQSGYAVPSGHRRVQFRIFIPSAGWNDSRAREARGVADVELVAGHRYRIAGNYSSTPRTFYLLDITTNLPVSPAIDLGFFGPIRRDSEFIPVFIPIKS